MIAAVGGSAQEFNGRPPECLFQDDVSVLVGEGDAEVRKGGFLVHVAAARFPQQVEERSVGRAEDLEDRGALAEEVLAGKGTTAAFEETYGEDGVRGAGHVRAISDKGDGRGAGGGRGGGAAGREGVDGRGEGLETVRGGFNVRHGGYR